VSERFDENGKPWAQLPEEFDPDYVHPEKPDPFVGPHGGIPKVYWNDPHHDEKVRELIEVAMEKVQRDGLLRGIGVMDFDDCTVVAISHTVPHGEVFVTRLEGQNSIMHGGFGLN